VRAWDEWGAVVAVAMAALPLAAIVVAVIATRRRARNAPASQAWWSAAAEVGIVVGTLPWLWMILTPRGTGRALNLIPLRELAQQLTGDPGTAVAQIGGNLLVFAAAGFFVPVRWRVGLITVLVGAAAGSLFVETIQYVAAIGRVSSVDDVLLNAAGAVLAAILSRPWWNHGVVPLSETV
jgi:hypothetical protein